MDLLAAKERGLDAYMAAHKLDAVLFPGATGAAIAAKSGYPSVQVPAGLIAGVGGKETPDYPLGITFTGRAWSEPSCCASPMPTSKRRSCAARRRCSFDLGRLCRRKIHRSARFSPQNRPIAGLSRVAIRHALISAAGVSIYQRKGQRSGCLVSWKINLVMAPGSGNS